MEETEKVNNRLPSQEIDYLKIAKIVLSRWYWILTTVMISILSVNIYLWYTPKIYATSSTMKFEEKKTALPDLGGLPNLTGRSNASRIQTETTVLQSTALLVSAIKQLDYRISFYIVGRVLNRTNEQYPHKLLDIQLIKFDSLNFFHDQLTFKPLDKKSFTIEFLKNGKTISSVYQYDVPFSIGPTAFSIKYPGDISKSSSYLFKVNTPEDFLGRVRAGFHAAETAKNSNIIAMQEYDSNPQFAADILNAIMKEYLNYDRNQRTLSTSQMIQFIDSQLDFLSKQVKGSANTIEQFKQSKKMMDVSSASQTAIGSAKEIESQQSLLKIQLLAINQLKQEIIRGKDNVTLNFSIGDAVQSQLAEFLINLNTLLAQRTSLLKTYNVDSKPILDINQQILQIKNDVLNSINASILSVQNKLDFLNSQLSPLNKQLSELPAAERDLVSLKRDFDINDKVYSFLSEKKLDAQISSAGVLPGATIIDLAQPNFNPIAPDESGLRKSAIIFGILTGLGVIILIRILNPYIYDKETIESLTAIPIIGVIRKYPEEIDEYSSQILAIARPKSIFAESVRSVRTNLNFLAADKKSKVICITSEVAGEGKSFIGVNLSSTLSLIDKKVILIAADLRRSKLHKTFHVSNDIGLSTYLSYQCESQDIIKFSEQKNLHFIVSGPVPPNPSELLHTTRMKDLIAELQKSYDIIMIDTAPVGLVSDSVPLIRLSDINVFVIRSGKSKIYAATVPQRIAQEYQLNNSVIVLNAYSQDLLHSRYYTTKFTNESYGSRYYYYSDYTGYEGSGYYLDENKINWWNFKHWYKKWF